MPARVTTIDSVSGLREIHRPASSGAVDEAYVHCAKAVRRGGLWSPERWPDAETRPNAARMIKDHAAIDVPAEVIEQALERDLAETLWAPGGS